MSTDTAQLADRTVTTLKHQVDYDRLKKALNWLPEGAIVDATFIPRTANDPTNTGHQERAMVVYGRLRTDGLRKVLEDVVDADQRRHWATTVELRDDKGTPHFHLGLAMPCYDHEIVRRLGGSTEVQASMVEKFKAQIGI